MRIFTFLVVLLLLSLGGFVIYQSKIHNPEVARELRANPEGVQAARVMLMTIDDRKTIPVNYLREGNEVFVGADGPWWRIMHEKEQPVTLLIKGQKLSGRARAVSGRPGYTKEVFKRLRPTAPKWLPDWLNGVLVVIELAGVEEQTADQIDEVISKREIFVKGSSE